MYVLGHFKPSLGKKSSGNRYHKVTKIDLFPDEQPDMLKMLSGEIEHVVRTVGFEAEWFSVDRYVSQWQKNLEKFLSKHAEIRDLLRSFESDSGDMGAQFKMMIDSLHMLSKLLGNSHNEWHKRSMDECLESNLPPRLYTLYNVSYIQKISAFRIMADDLDHLQRTLYLVRSNDKKIQKEIRNFEGKYRTMNNSLLAVSRSESVLKFFLQSKNAHNIGDLFRSIPLTLDAASGKQFEEFLNSFDNSVSNLTHVLDQGYLDKDIEIHLKNSKYFDEFNEGLSAVVAEHG